MNWVVVFKGARDAYQVPLALAEAGRLETLFTDWYSPLDRKWFQQALSILPEQQRAAFRSRYCSGVSSSKVRTSPFEFARAKVSAHNASASGDNRIGTLAGRFAKARSAGIFSYSYYGYAAFRAYGDGPYPKMLFQAHPHPKSVRKLLLEEMELLPDCRESLAREIELSMPQDRFEQLSEEPLMADRCLVASHYTKATLTENGVAPDRIKVIPYGVDLDRFHPPAKRPSRPFRVLFVGQMVQRKGLWYLLEAWRRLALSNAELVLAGRGNFDREMLAKFAGQYRLSVAVNPRELVELYQTSDLCCVPSLVEGFGQVFLESLACGTPVIATPHTGAADLIVNGEEGFIVNLRSVDELMNRLEWCYFHREALSQMREKARQRAEEYTWQTFRHSVALEVPCQA